MTTTVTMRSIAKSAPRGPAHNRVLALLPEAELLRLEAAGLQPVELHAGAVLYDVGQPRRFACFPTSGVIGFLVVLSNGSTVEIGIVGDDGFAGVAIAMGGGSMQTRMQVLTSGYGYRLSAEAFEAELARDEAFRLLARRYTQAFTTQIAQMSACNLHHALRQRLARWVLMRLDRTHSQGLVMTHESVAGLVGARREGITRAMHRMQMAGVIECGRGTIDVVDRAGLEAMSCECYSVIVREAERLLPRSTLESAGSRAGPPLAVSESE